MVKVKLLHLDGYADWIPTNVSDIELTAFTPKDLALFLSDGESEDSNDFHISDTPVKVHKGTISFMGEEEGYIAVLLNGDK